VGRYDGTSAVNTEPAMREKIGLTLFGFLFLIVGLGVGYMMYTQPEGLNPEWPLWLAMTAPAVFAFGGLHLLATGLGFPRLSIVMIQAILMAFFGIFNWAAFFTANIQCTESVSFLGIEFVRKIPSEEACQNGMRLVIGSIDLIIFLGLLAFAKQKFKQSRNDSPTIR
jgi:hypothetical protein